MDELHFDALTRILTQLRSRRGLARLLGSLALSAPLALLGLRETAAKKKGGKGKGRKKKRNTAPRDPGTSPPAPIFSFKADPMTKANVVPTFCASAGTSATGQAQFTIQGATICGTFQVTGLSGAPTGQRVHTGVAGTSGPPVVDFSGAALAERLCLPCPGTVCANIVANPAAFFADISTSACAAGEVRAQLQAV